MKLKLLIISFFISFIYLFDIFFSTSVSFLTIEALAYGKDEIQVLVSSLNAIFTTSQYLSDSVVLSLLNDLNARYVGELLYM